MFQFYINMYKKLEKDAHNDAVVRAYMRIIASLETHASMEHDIESVRSEVQAMRDDAIQVYHKASTDYGKQQATMKIDTYAFFLYLSQNPPSELPFK